MPAAGCGGGGRGNRGRIELALLWTARLGRLGGPGSIPSSQLVCGAVGPNGAQPFDTPAFVRKRAMRILCT